MVSEDLLRRIETATGGEIPIPQADTGLQTISIDALNQYVGGIGSLGGVANTAWGGDKFLGGFGLTKDYEVVDYWLLRKRSKQLFTENLYARGLIRRLLTNIIHEGLALESTPDAEILGIDAEVASLWSEKTERRFSIYGKNPRICDWRERHTFGELQNQAELMAMVSGDVLVVLRQSEVGLPKTDLIDADCVTDPMNGKYQAAATAAGNEIKSGVEIDAQGRHVAFFVQKKDGTHERIPAYGKKSGRKQAWLYYYSEKMIDEVRGQSLLGLVLQSLKEMDRGRDSELRAMVVNSMIAMWIEKTQDKMGTLPITGGAVRKDTVTTQNDTQGRHDAVFSTMMPGMVVQELQQGEKPTSYDTKRPNVNWSVFESAILSAVAWANEIPPETLFLQFQNNYSASRGATNEFILFLDKRRARHGTGFSGFIYEEYLLSEIINGDIVAPGYFDAFMQKKWPITGAWNLASWSGAIKPNVDMLKEAKAVKLLADEGWITRDRASRQLTGMKYSKVVAQLKRENEMLAEALEPLIKYGMLGIGKMVEEDPEADPDKEDKTEDKKDKADE